MKFSFLAFIELSLGTDVHNVHAVAIEKEDSYRQPKLAGHVSLLYSKVIAMFVTLPIEVVATCWKFQFHITLTATKRE